MSPHRSLSRRTEASTFASSVEAGRVDRLLSNGTSGEPVAKFNGTCFGLFIDLNNTLYCSMNAQHKIASISLNDFTNVSTIVAGTGGSGPSSDQLDNPWGIFVDIKFDMYVADAGNHRIQRFRPGSLNGTTVAQNGTPNGLSLNYPTDIILDGDGYMYIADNNNHRIIRAGPNDSRCIAGCSGVNGSSPSQLNVPYSLRFDSRGNIYVADENNHRIQKFMFLTNSCSECNA